MRPTVAFRRSNDLWRTNPASGEKGEGFADFDSMINGPEPQPRFNNA